MEQSLDATASMSCIVGGLISQAVHFPQTEAEAYKQTTPPLYNSVRISHLFRAISSTGLRVRTQYVSSSNS